MMLQTKDFRGDLVFIASQRITHMCQVLGDGEQIGDLIGPLTKVVLDGDSILCKESIDSLRIKYDNICNR